MEKTPRILAIDDVAENLVVLRGILRKNGYAILTASDADVGRRLAIAEQPGLILLDISMPGKDGIALCRELREDPRTRPIPVIFITTNATSHVLVRALDAGGVDFIAKPFDPAETLARIRTHLRLRAETEARMNYQAAAFAARRRAWLGDLLAGLAHNLNNLLTIIAGNLELALAEKISSQERTKRMGKALDTARRIGEILGRTTRFLRRRLEPERAGDGGFSVCDEVRAVTEVFASAMPRGIRVELQIDAEGIRVPGAPEEFRESLSAILQNARESIPPQEEGIIGVEVEGMEREGPAPMVRVRVRDTGRGMDEETVSRARNPFFSTKGEVGVGLGLMIVEAFAAGCGGRLELESVPGHGTRASLILPVAQGPRGPASGDEAKEECVGDP